MKLTKKERDILMHSLHLLREQKTLSSLEDRRVAATLMLRLTNSSILEDLQSIEASITRLEPQSHNCGYVDPAGEQGQECPNCS